MKYGAVLVVLLLSLSTIERMYAGADALKPAEGETLLNAADAAGVLAEISETFKQAPYVRAQIVTEVEDLLLGKRVEEGTLLLDRSGRVMRKFSKPAVKMWLLDAGQLQEYNPKRKTVYVKDLTQAPKALKLIQAAATADVKTLEEIFDMHVFRYDKEGQKTYRLVLAAKTGGGSPMAYKWIQGRIAEKALFFEEIEYVPNAGDRTLERYKEIQSIAKPADAEFSLDAPADVKRKVDIVAASIESTENGK